MRSRGWTPPLPWQGRTRPFRAQGCLSLYMHGCIVYLDGFTSQDKEADIRAEETEPLIHPHSPVPLGTCMQDKIGHHRSQTHHDSH